MKRMSLLLVIVLTAEIIIAIVCGPHSCEWGNSVYFYSGIACAILTCILPFFQKSLTFKKEIVYCFLFFLITAIVWCAGFMLFGFKIMCRLF